MDLSSPQKAPSIEDILKKPSGGATSSSSTPRPGVIKGAPPKVAKKTTAKSFDEMTKAEQLQQKQIEILQQDTEKRTQERSAELRLPYINLRGFPISPEALALIPVAEAKEKHTIAFYNADNQIRIATTAPGPDVIAIAERIAKKEHADVETYFVSPVSFEEALKLYSAIPEKIEAEYGVRIDEQVLKKYAQEISDFHQLQEKLATVSTTDVITLIIGTALQGHASDIHIEAEEMDVKVRLRIDGILQDAARLPREAWKQMIVRLKLLAEVKINIEGLPQDGRITIFLGEEKIDIRVSFLPTAFGESIVMRILRPKVISLEFDNLGIRDAAFEQLKREIERPNGMIVTTGPTGSGKTTTLYAVLKKLNTPEVKIITLEDPVEYKLEGINQSQIDHEKNYDFAKGLRSILRQDPDVVMVGEIRDLETADIAIQAALTGHLVVSTLHTNSAAAAVPRFLSMGVKPFLLAPAVNAIIGQRLVRRLCTACKVPLELDVAIMAQVRDTLSKLPPSEKKLDLNHLTFFGPAPTGTKCDTCKGIGYKGRVGIYEVLVMSKEIEHVILSGNVSEYQMADIAEKQGMLTMAQDGLLKALDGLTSVDEVLRVAQIEAVTEDVPEAAPEKTETAST